MAEIQIERKKRSAAPWLLGVLLFLVLLGASWYFVLRPEGLP